MRILYISHCTDRNGATIALVNIIQGMLRRECEIGVVLPDNEGFLFNILMDLGVKVYCSKKYPSIMEKPLWQKGLKYYKEYIKYGKIICQVHLYIYKIIKEFNPDIVHTNTSAIDYALTGCFLTHKPHVWHLREILDKGCNISVFPNMYLLRKKMQLPFNYSIAITKSVFNYYNLQQKDKVIYDGVINDKFDYEKSALLKFPYFISVGYVNSVKGFLQLVQQFSIFSKTNNDMHLVIVGDYNPSSSYYKKCQECIEYNKIMNRVHFLGLRNDVYRLIKNSKALIIASSCEGFGFTCVEAMYCETLVIGRNTAGIKEQFDIGLEQSGGEIGLRFDTDNQIPDLLIKSLSCDFLSMKKNAKKVVLNNYTIQKNVDTIYGYYTDILNANNKTISYGK